ncbi:hypothetical protein [Nocardia asiatica]
MSAWLAAVILVAAIGFAYLDRLIPHSQKPRCRAERDGGSNYGSTEPDASLPFLSADHAVTATPEVVPRFPMPFET